MEIEETARLVVLISGTGSNLQAIIDACDSGQLPARVVAVVANRAEAYGLRRAERHQIPAVVVPPVPDRTAYDASLAERVGWYEPDWIILAGWMRLLSMSFLGQFPNQVINLHPALPGHFPGTRAIERAFEAARRGEIDRTGVMVHLVPDEGVDNGPVLASRPVPILPDDTLATLTERIHIVEHGLLVETLGRVVSGQLKPESL